MDMDRSLCRGSPSWYCSWAPQQHQKVLLEPALGNGAQRQRSKCCLSWGKHHPWSLKRAEPPLASCSDPCLPFSVDTFEMARFWSRFSVFASTNFAGSSSSDTLVSTVGHLSPHLKVPHVAWLSKMLSIQTLHGVLKGDWHIWQKWAFSQSHWRILKPIQFSTAAQENLEINELLQARFKML